MNYSSPELELGKLSEAFSVELEGTNDGPPDQRLVAAAAAAGYPHLGGFLSWVWQETQTGSREEPPALRVAFAVLALQPGTAVGRTLRRAAAVVFRSYGLMLLPYVDLHDFEVRVLERSWRIRSQVLKTALERERVAALLRQVARWVALDELRAMERRPRVAFDDSVVAQLASESPSIDDALDARTLLASLADEVPAWAADVVVAVLLDEVERTDALRVLNERRAALGQPEWSMDTMRVWLHRVRLRLRDAAAR